MGIHASPEKTSAVADLREPTSVTEIRQFLGLTGFYRCFIHQYATIAKPLSDLTKKNSQFTWSPDRSKAFKTLKTSIINAPVLAHPDYTGDFSIYTDASKVGVGAVLTQKKRPIWFTSRSLQGAELNYDTREKECLAILHALDKFRSYIYGKDITIFTDHGNLRWLFDQQQTGRLARWVCKLQQYNLTIAYIPGPQNTVADALSRYGIVDSSLNTMKLRNRKHVNYKESVDSEDKSHAVSANPPSIVNQFLEVDWAAEQQKDSKLIADSIREHSNYSITDNIIYRRTAKHTKIAVPEHLIDSLINAAHTSILANHPGIKQTMYHLRIYWFSGFRTRIEQTLKTCKTCLLSKPSVSSKNYQTRLPSKPMERLSIDVKGPLPISPDHWKKDKKYIITILDESTKFINGIPTSNCTAPTIIKAIERHWIQLFGPPKEIITDEGSQFLGNEFDQFTLQYNIKLTPTAPYSQFQNPVERVHREIGNKIRAIKHSTGISWAESLHLTILSINNSKNSSTGNSPMKLLFGQTIDPVTLNRETFMNDIKAIRTKSNIQAYNTRQNALDKINKTKIDYKKGDQVFISNSWRSSKLDYFYLNTPLIFISEVATNIAQLQAENGKLISCHFHDIRKL